MTRAADAALPRRPPRSPTPADPRGRAGHRPRVPPHPASLRPSAPRRRGRSTASRSASRRRPCTRRTSTPTGPATRSSPGASPRRSTRHGLTRCATTATSRSPRPARLRGQRVRRTAAGLARRGPARAPRRHRRLPDRAPARAAVAAHHAAARDEVLATAGAAEAFTPHRPAASLAASGGHPSAVHRAGRRAASRPATRSTEVVLRRTVRPRSRPGARRRRPGGRRQPDQPDRRPPPGRRHRALLRPGRLVVVDEAFMDCVPGEPESLAGAPRRRAGRDPQPHQALVHPGRPSRLPPRRRRRSSPRCAGPGAVVGLGPGRRRRGGVHDARGRRGGDVGARIEIADWRKPSKPASPASASTTSSSAARSCSHGSAPVCTGTCASPASPYAVRTPSPASTTPGSGSRYIRRRRPSDCSPRSPPALPTDGRDRSDPDRVPLRYGCRSSRGRSQVRARPGRWDTGPHRAGRHCKRRRSGDAGAGCDVLRHERIGAERVRAHLAPARGWQQQRLAPEGSCPGRRSRRAAGAR